MKCLSEWPSFYRVFIMSPHLLFQSFLSNRPSPPFFTLYFYLCLRLFKKLPPIVCQKIGNLRIDHFFCVLLSAGITRFDLLGDFGRFNWLGNFYIVLSYNLLFAVVTTLCLVRKFTSAVREELLKALGNVFCPTLFC